MMKKYIIVGILIAIASLISVILSSSVSDASTMTLYPNQDPSDLTGSSTTSWVASPAISQFSILRRTSYDESQSICGNGGTWGYRYGMDNVSSVGQGAYSITFNTSPKVRRSSIFTTPDDQTFVGGYINSTTSLGALDYWKPGWTDTSGSTCSLTFTVNTEYPHSTTYTKASGYWTTSDINSLEMYLGRQTVGSADVIKVFKASAAISYDAVPNVTTYLNQAFNDSNSTTPGTSLSGGYVGADEPTSLTSRGQKFRLRMSAYNVTGDAWQIGYGSLKLQYAKKTGTSCTTQTGWSDVSASSANIRFYDNPNITDGVAFDYQSGDMLAGNGIAQAYKESNPVTIIKTVPRGTPTASWDFSLQEDPTALGGSFCFKLTPLSPLTEYTEFFSPIEIITIPAPLGVDIVDNSNNGVSNPTTSFGLLTASSQCQQSTAVFGTTSQKIRVTNGTATNGWSVSIAATNGSSALWATGGGSQYDFNDSSGSTSGCADGGDGDSKAGQLALKPNNATISPTANCTNTGVSKGSNAAFSEGTLNSITLLSASSGADMYCAWDMKDVGLSQTIPAGTPTGTYSIDLTLTAVAS